MFDVAALYFLCALVIEKFEAYLQYCLYLFKVLESLYSDAVCPSFV